MKPWNQLVFIWVKTLEFADAQDIELGDASVALHSAAD